MERMHLPGSAASNDLPPTERDLTDEEFEGLALRGQALNIIHVILSGTAPEDAANRKALSAQLEQHPGAPELALLEHLKATREASRADDKKTP